MDEQKRCCVPCDAKRKCHICKAKTQYACSDCAIDLGATVYICSKSECRDAHELKCPHSLIAELTKLRRELEAVKIHVETITKYLSLGQPFKDGIFIEGRHSLKVYEAVDSAKKCIIALKENKL